MEQQYMRVYKNMIKNFGVGVATLFGALLNTYSYAQSRYKVYDGFFYAPTEFLHDFLGLARKTQVKYLNVLIDAGLIEVKYYGMPQRRMVKINNLESYHLET